MALIDVEAEILGPMQAVFLPPRNMDEGQQRATLREYGDALGGYDRPTLKAAWRAVRDTHATRSWPVPGLFVSAAKDARKELAPPSKTMRDKEREERAKAWERWKTIRNTPMARQAVLQGVAWALKCRVVNDLKLPEQIDLRELVMAKNSAASLAEKIEHGGEFEHDGKRRKFTDDQTIVALKMYRTMQVREAETQAEINYGSAA